MALSQMLSYIITWLTNICKHTHVDATVLYPETAWFCRIMLFRKAVHLKAIDIYHFSRSKHFGLFRPVRPPRIVKGLLGHINGNSQLLGQNPYPTHMVGMFMGNKNGPYLRWHQTSLCHAVKHLTPADTGVN